MNEVGKEKKTGFTFTKENMARDVRPDHWWYKGLALTKAQVLEAMANTRSNQEAARWLGIHYRTWKKYAKMYKDEETGKTLFAKHMNISGVGIPRNWAGGHWQKTLDEMLTVNQPMGSKHIRNLKELLMKDGRLGFKCHGCGYCEKRLTDMRSPLLIHFKNGLKSDWRLENLQWMCYNCYFVLIGDFFTNKLIERVETMTLTDPVIRDEIQSAFELDDFYYDHLRKLGLDGEGDVHFKNTEEPKDLEEGEEFVDFKK